VAARPLHSPKDEPLLLTSALISVIDDDESFRVATDSLLRARGYAVRTFESAREFLQSPLLDETACVITDVQMPEIDGLQLQTLLRDQGRTVAIIFITAFPEESVRVLSMRDGAICFLSTNSKAATLIKCVERALSGRGGTQ
jgi:FixJ family two-component response regulator